MLRADQARLGAPLTGLSFNRAFLRGVVLNVVTELAGHTNVSLKLLAGTWELQCQDSFQFLFLRGHTQRVDLLPQDGQVWEPDPGFLRLRQIL